MANLRWVSFFGPHCITQLIPEMLGDFLNVIVATKNSQ